MRTHRMTDDAISSMLGEAIRDRRLRKNVSQGQLAEMVGVSLPTLQKLEKGQGSIANLIAALRGLGGLDLLVPLITPPPVSPMEVSKTSSAKKRLRAAPPHASKGEGKVQGFGPSASISALLIPRKTTKGSKEDA